MDRSIVVSIILIILLYGVVGHLDYVDSRTMECLEKSLPYDSKKDTCKWEQK